MVFLRKTVYVVLVVSVFLLSASGLCWANENGFEPVLSKYVTKVFLSPNFVQDGTVFAFVKQLPSGIVVGDAQFGYVLYRSTDGGKTWKEIRWLIDNAYRTSEEVTELHDLCFSPDGSMYLAGKLKDESACFLWMSRDSGNRWETIDSDQGAPVSIESAGDKLLGIFRLKYGSMATLKASGDGGKTWPSDIKASVVPDSRSIVALDGSKYFVVLNDNSLWATVDSGKTWRDTGIRLSEIRDPAGPPPEPGVSPSMLKGEVVAAREVSSAETIVACSPSVAAGVFISRDGGATWKQADRSQFEWRPKYSASRAITVAAAPGGLVFAGTEDDCVLVSEDYGVTWKPVTKGVSDAVTDMACAATGDTVTVFAVSPDGLRRMEYKKEQKAENPKPPEQTPIGPPAKPVIKFVVKQSEYRIGEQAFDMDAATFVENGRTYIPVRYLGDALGAQVEWNTATKTVTLKKGDVVVKLVIGNKAVYVNDAVKQADAAPVIRSNRTYLPARCVAEAFGYTITWDATIQTVTVS